MNIDTNKVLLTQIAAKIFAERPWEGPAMAFDHAKRFMAERAVQCSDENPLLLSDREARAVHFALTDDRGRMTAKLLEPVDTDVLAALLSRLGAVL